jgi:hypothetical protein
MYLSVISAKPLDDYKLLLAFENSEEKIFDVKPYLEIGKFKELKDINLFNSVKVKFDSIGWDNMLDLDPELLYDKSVLRK